MFAKTRLAAIAAVTASVLVAGTASAQEAIRYNGYYVSAMAGVNFAERSDISGTGISTNAKYDDGYAGALAFGRAFGNGLRLEGELSRRANDVDNFGGTSATGDFTASAFMVNALYDFDIGMRVVPYIGAGLGLARIDAEARPIGGSTTDDSDTDLAWQAMIGISIPMSQSWALTAEARHFNGGDPNFTLASGTEVNADYEATSLMVGVRFNLTPPAPAPKAPEPMPAAEPAPAPAPAAKPAPEPAPPAGPRSFLVFFDWDKADIRADARQILEAAARAAKNGNQVRIQLTGHADRSGPAGYNQRLSVRRANNAKEVLVGLGIPANQIGTVGRGETEPLVSTADGVREPRNRRVEIAF